jgi:hypothetical protein
MQNEVTQYQMAIVPSNTSGEGDPKCELVVYASIVIIREPIDANGANDMDSLANAHDSVARRLGVHIENVNY